MKKSFFFLLLIGFSQSTLAELRSFQCHFTDNKGRSVVSTLQIDGDYVGRQVFVGLLNLKVDDFTFPSIPVKVRDLVINEKGQITSAKARHEDDSKRAYMGALDGATQATAQFDMTEALSGGKVLPATCTEL